MTQTKNTHVRTSKIKLATKTARPAETHDDETIESPILKSKKPAELELPEEPIALPLEEKSDEEGADTEDAEETINDELSLDEEELNPFGDKWEQ